MNDLIPYLGVAILILVSAATAAFLASRGLWLRRVRHDKTEVEFDTIMKEQSEIAQTNTSVPSTGDIDLTQELVHDCEVLGLPPSNVREFILREAERHPILFLSDFYSLPLVFFHYVLLLSWNRKRVKAERLLKREEAYPINDLWSSCLAAYRKATMLPYRQAGPNRLVSSTDAKQSVAAYRRLVRVASDFLDGLKSHASHRPTEYDALPALIEEAEFALASEDFGTAVSRMEALLSIVHKLILLHAPQGTGKAYREEKDDFLELRTSTGKSVDSDCG